jgi:3-methylcrotonyl-CoA carboxylase alpha subunit
MPNRQKRPINKLFIANRGEIACRTIRTCLEMGIKSVVGYSDCDALSYHVRMADEAVHLGPSPAKLSYLDIGKVIDAARVARTATRCFPGTGSCPRIPSSDGPASTRD